MTISMNEAMKSVVRRALHNIHTCIPGEIEKYDHEIQSANVKVMVKKKFRDGTIKPYPILTNCPVVWPRGNNSGLTFPLRRGDGVLVLFSERGIDNYITTGKQSEPTDFRKFSLTDAICIPGMNAFTAGSVAENNDDVLLTHNGGKITIKPSGDIEIDAPNVTVNASKITMNGEVEINGNTQINGSLNVTQDSIIDGEVEGNGISLTQHVHDGVATGGGETGPPVPDEEGV